MRLVVGLVLSRRPRMSTHGARTIGWPGGARHDHAWMEVFQPGRNRSIPDHRAMQIIRICALDLHGGDLAHPQRPARRHVDCAVDLRGVARRSTFAPAVADLIDDDMLARAYTALEAARRDRLLALHEAAPALFLHLVRYGLGEIVGSRAFHGLVAETADPVERRLVKPVKEKRKFLLGLARKADDEG